jgi:very-short-patch-repair endonuclease
MAYIGKTREISYFYNADQETIELAKHLRKKSTPTEKLLWERLRRNNISGVKFRRQHPIGFYIADFYCHELQLVIEIDGPIHNTAQHKEYDFNRDAEMERMGVQILRFTNNEVKNQIDKVMNKIRQEIKSRLNST